MMKPSHILAGATGVPNPAPERAPTGDNAEARLDCLAEILSDIACRCGTTRSVLSDGAEDPNAAHMAASALEVIGWIADRAILLTGRDHPQYGGGADNWIFGVNLAKRIKQAEGARHD